VRLGVIALGLSDVVADTPWPPACGPAFPNQPGEGTGYSSLSYLMRFPVDIVKVDRAFVADLQEDSASHTIVAAFIQLAHDLGMSIVCEGVETAEQRDELSRIGCDSCQGFYFGAPMSASRLDSLIRRFPS
jgi:EAL domain-containing protein (putative c-di-GMP-specific phosphodiesterase class I)